MLQKLILHFHFMYLVVLPLYSIAYISDDFKHQQNIQLCRQYFEQWLQENRLSSQETAEKIAYQLPRIAKELMDRGFDLTIYSYKTDSKNGLVFSVVPIWEGERVKPSLPLSLFIYGWPPESWAQHCQSPTLAYSTPIHAHPLMCALTVLRGTVTQELYQPIFDGQQKKAKQIGREVIRPGQLIFDRPDSPIAHRIVCQDEGQLAALTLHAYGASTGAQVQQIFRMTAKDYNYKN